MCSLIPDPLIQSENNPTGVIPKVPKNWAQPVKGRQPRIFNNSGGIINENPLKTDDFKVESIASIQENEISSPSQKKWQQKSLGVSSKTNYFIVFNKQKIKSPKLKIVQGPK